MESYQTGEPHLKIMSNQLNDVCPIHRLITAVSDYLWSDRFTVESTRLSQTDLLSHQENVTSYHTCDHDNVRPIHNQIHARKRQMKSQSDHDECQTDSSSLLLSTFGVIIG